MTDSVRDANAFIIIIIIIIINNNNNNNNIVDDDISRHFSCRNHHRHPTRRRPRHARACFQGAEVRDSDWEIQPSHWAGRGDAREYCSHGVFQG